VPLHQERPPVRSREKLDHLVRRPPEHLEAVARPLHGLMVVAVHARALRNAESVGALNAQPVESTWVEAMMRVPAHIAVALVCEVLTQGASECDIHYLAAPADPENRETSIPRCPNKLQLVLVARAIHSGGKRREGQSVVVGVHVPAAR